MGGRRGALGRFILGVLALACLPRPAEAVLATPGFRAVGVAHAAYPIAALAVAPDGRLFATVQALGGTSGTTSGTAEIRVYGGYATNDGSVLDEGSTWATIDGVRATSVDEGLLGIALAPDFATSKLVYVQITTTDEEANQHVRVYRENAGGTGDYLGTVQTSLELPGDTGTTRSGGALAFGADGCLYVGDGDQGGSSRWTAQLLVGTDPISGTESSELCTDVCLGTTLYPPRTTDNGAPTHAGKVLRLDVEGASTAASAPGAPLAAQPFAFATGLRNPTGLVAHPLTGQLFATDRGDTVQAEINVVETGGNHGWPCVEGAVTNPTMGCLAGHTVDEVYANHPEWRRPLVAHTGNPGVSAPAVYTGLAYPEEFYGDVFYTLRQSARIYRIDLTPPCFLPDPAGVAPLAFHDVATDGDFNVSYDIDDDGDIDNINHTLLTAMVQGPDPLGRQVLYVAGRQNESSGHTEDSVVFRIEYATAFTPYAGPTGHVADTCFAGSGWENPFVRTSCMPPGGPCPGQPDGTPCDDGDVCNGAETCLAGICRHGTPLADGSTCLGGDPCRTAWTCQAGTCVAGSTSPDGTPCPDGDPCNGLETCTAGQCVATNGPDVLAIRSLTVKRDLRGPGTGALQLSGSITPRAPLAPSTSDALTVELRDSAGQLFSATLAHPDSDPAWRRSRPNHERFRRGGSGLTAVSLKSDRSGGVGVTLRGKRLAFTGLDEAALTTRLIIGQQCFVADLGTRCTLEAMKLRCR
jgi:glucose/arabinose dehydrogenase